MAIQDANDVEIVNTDLIPGVVRGAGAEANTGNVAAPAANTPAQISYGAAANQRHYVEVIAWSYDAAPTGGQLTVHDGAGNTWFNIDITAAGPGFIPFSPEMTPIGSALYVTLTAGGAGISGKVNVIGHRLI